MKAIFSVLAIAPKVSTCKVKPSTEKLKPSTEKLEKE